MEFDEDAVAAAEDVSAPEAAEAVSEVAAEVAGAEAATEAEDDDEPQAPRPRIIIPAITTDKTFFFIFLLLSSDSSICISFGFIIHILCAI